jgi:hypothetical protein
MGGQSNGYQSQPMQSWGGGYGGSGSGGGYGMGNYNNNFSNRAPMYGQQSSQNYGGIQGGGGGQGGGGSFSGGNMAWRDPNSPLYNWDQTHAGGQQGGFGQQSSQNYGGSGGSQQPMSYDAYMQAHAGQPIQSSDYGNYVQGFNQSQNQQPFTGRGGGTYTPGMNLFGNGGGNQYGNPFSQFMQQWPQFGRQYMGGQQLYGNPGGMGIPQGPQSIGGMGVMGGNMINPNGVGDPSQNYRQQIRLQAGPQYETTGIVPPGGMTQNNGQLDYATQQQPFGGGF